ncbi:MAG: GTP cyclohydrolase II [Alphaproteobacteria bacterium]|nr:GTP cyclohydrolase II [Alphaproteobacteria bacterium]
MYKLIHVIFISFMQLLSSKEQGLLRVSRAIGDLRLGMPVQISKKYIIFAIETINQKIFQSIARSSDAMLVIPSCKVIHSDQDSGVLSFNVRNKSFEEIVEFCCLEKIDVNQLETVQIDDKYLDAGMSIVKAAELLPIILMFQIKNEASILGNISSLEIENVGQFINHTNNNLEMVSSANLNLRHAEKAKILSFRSKFIGQDHYAIIVGDISKVKVPSLRIHSSCYTGDLMGSLSCDCRDQLFETIKYMGSSEENAGIIIYLLQEGRGIGLTNKIRTYQLQQDGQDTVEANHLLGFEEDERIFDAASVILNMLDIAKVNLLTNNPKKINFLKGKGIEVCKTISLFGAVNKYNKTYLETKKSKMGHAL